MSLKKNGVDLSNLVYGFGTATTFNGFATKQFGDSGGFTKDGVPYRMVGHHSTYMPFSNETITGFKDSGTNVLLGNSFAAVNRFITSNTARITSTPSSGTTSIIYQGGGSYQSLGNLWIGGTKVSSSCPPVILVALQAAGGNGGSGDYSKQWAINAWEEAGGGGGASGGFTCFLMQMPYTTSIVKVGDFKVSSGSVSFFAPGSTTAFCAVAAGGNGGNGSASWEFFKGFSYTVGAAGVAGECSFVSEPSNFYRFVINSEDGSSRGWYLSGKNGGIGGACGNNHDGGGGIDLAYFLPLPGAGGSMGGTSCYINPSGSSLTGNAGGAGGRTALEQYSKKGWSGGGGAGSMFGTGGTRGTEATGYGAGGAGGGWGVSAGSGTGACVRFYW